MQDSYFSHLIDQSLCQNSFLNITIVSENHRASLLFNTKNIVIILHKHSTQSSIIIKNSSLFYSIATTQI